MSRRRQHRSGPPRCRTCGQPVVLLLLRGKWRTFQARAVDGRTYLGGTAHPVEGKYAWPSLRELVEDLMVRRECGRDAATDEAYDMPFYARHYCPADTTIEEDQE